MAAYQAGELAAFEELYQRYAGRLYGYLSGNHEIINRRDDVFQSTWEKVHRFRHSYLPGKPFSKWLFAICHNVVVDHHRKAARDKSTIAFDETLHGSTLDTNDKAFSRRLEEAMAHLEKTDQEILAKHYRDDEAFDAVGKQLNLTGAATRKRASRAFAKLRTLLEKS
jgi:RNA polymerase sigma-70 factor (ECF subfamily)